jgi:hypothetical protein
MEMEEKNNMEQTAVEWFYDQIENEGKCIYEVFEQAKEMEKEQKKKFFKVGFSQGFASDIISYHKLDNEKEKLFEQYYNETFKSDEKI